MRTNIAACAALLLAACTEPVPVDHGWQGYVEGEFVLLASPYAGQLKKLHVQRGGRIEAGKSVFVLEHESEIAARREAGFRVKSAQARLENLRGARRTPELDAVHAQLAQAVAARQLSASQLTREEKLYRDGFTARGRLDEARAASRRDQARVAELAAQVRNLGQPIGRDAELVASESDAAAAAAALEQAEWRLAQKSLIAPATGWVQDTFYSEGEWVPAGRPVISLLPPGNVKVRFFVPETALGGIRAGNAVRILCDGCGSAIEAKVTYISTRPEYTPPVLYGKDARAKLVFMVEARPQPNDAIRLHPGQPVNVLAR